MITRLPALFLLLALCTGATHAAGESRTRSGVDTRAYDPVAAERSLLVTFRDRGINRVAVGPRSSQYASRGGYDSTLWAQRIAARIAADHKLEIVIQWPITELGVHCVVYYVPDADAVEERERSLANDERVEQVQRMGVFRTLATSGDDPYYHLQRNMQVLQIDRLHRRATGQGTRIAIIDTGVDLTHPDLEGQFLDDRNFVPDISPAFETDRHGTAVAGVIGARSGNDTGIVGIAPDAKLYAYKACWQVTEDDMEAVCNSLTLALAINLAIRKDADIINLSLTGPEDALLAALLNRALERGILVVAADDRAAGEPPGFPASLPRIIAVRNSTNALPGAELQSNLVTLPGTGILTTMPRGTYDFMSGSSFSAASASGLAALMLELRPDLSGTEIMSALRRSGTDDLPALPVQPGRQ